MGDKTPWIGERDWFFVELIGFVAGGFVYMMICGLLFGERNLNVTYMLLSYVVVHALARALLAERFGKGSRPRTDIAQQPRSESASSGCISTDELRRWFTDARAAESGIDHTARKYIASQQRTRPTASSER